MKAQKKAGLPGQARFFVPLTAGLRMTGCCVGAGLKPALVGRMQYAPTPNHLSPIRAGAHRGL